MIEMVIEASEQERLNSWHEMRLGATYQTVSTK